MLRMLVAITAVVGLATPASAAVDLDIKRAIVGVVLQNLGVEASDAFVTEIAQGIDASELDAGLVNSVSNLLDTDVDPRSVIESQTDADGDGVPDEGAALSVDDSVARPNPNSTEKSGNSDDKSANSGNRNPNGTLNTVDCAPVDESDEDEDEDEEDDDGEEDEESEDDSCDRDDD